MNKRVLPPRFSMHLKSPPLIALLLTITFGFASSALLAEESKTPKVLLIGIDGLRTDALKAANTPNLDGLVKLGAMAENTQILSADFHRNDTLSGPGWSSILTGTWANKHGVLDNTFRAANFSRFPHFFARLKEVQPSLQTASFATWPQIAQKITSHADINELVQVEGTSANLYLRAELEVTELASAHLKTESADATFVYYGLVDSLGHTKGFHPEVPEYVQAIEIIDQCVGRLITALKERQSFKLEDWLIVVTTDHGGLGRNHQRGHRVPEVRDVFLIVSGPGAVAGKIDAPTSIVDVVPTIFTHLSVPIAEEWKLDGRPVGLKKPSGN